MKILLVGHACSPRQGSEPSGTWNWACQLSRRHQVCVLAYPHDRDFVEKVLAEHPNPRLSFHWSDLPSILAYLNFQRNDAGLQSAFLYLLWQRRAYQKAIEMQERIGFDIVHHVSYGSLSSPPPVWKFLIPFIWGPIGGAQKSSTSFRQYFGHRWPIEFIRNVRVRILPVFPSLRRAVRSCALILATNRDTSNALVGIGGRDVRLFLDSGIPSDFNSARHASRLHNGVLTLLWVGRMQPRKALPLALEALAQTKDVRVKLLIVGDGGMRKSWERLAKRLGVQDRVEFLGSVLWHEMPRLYKNVDALLFTSLRDSFGMQVLEAMGHGLPILTLDHQGVGTFVPHEAGIKVPVTSPRQTVGGLSAGIRRLALFPEERWKMGEAGRAYAQTQTWERHAERMSELYDEVLAKFDNHKAADLSGSRETATKLGEPATYGSCAVAKRIRKIDKTLDLKGMRVLDLGCGNGCYTAELVRRAEYVCGIDMHMPHLQAFQEAIPRVQGRGESLPFASGSFDAVTMIEVLEHTDSDTRVLAECFRVLKPGGLLVLFAPNKFYPFESHPCHIGGLQIGPNIPLVSWLPEFLHKRVCHARIYTRRRLFAMARKIGFRIQKSGFIFPPLDSFRLPFKATYRRIAARLEDSWLGNFGVSIYAILAKPAQSAKAEPQESAERVSQMYPSECLS